MNIKLDDVNGLFSDTTVEKILIDAIQAIDVLDNCLFLVENTQSLHPLVTEAVNTRYIITESKKKLISVIHAIEQKYNRLVR